MRPTLIPAKLKLRSKIHNVIFLWNETWGFTDDFFLFGKGIPLSPTLGIKYTL